MKLPLITALLSLSFGSAEATLYTFDVDNSYGQGWFTMDLPETWAGLPWKDFLDFQYFPVVEFSGQVAIRTAQGATGNAPWAAFLPGFFNERFGAVGPPETTSSNFFVRCAPDDVLLSDGSYISSPGVLYAFQRGVGSSPVEALENFPGVTMRQASTVPDSGSTGWLGLVGLLAMVSFRCSASRQRTGSRS